jgi:hypothetical protein
MRSSYVFTLAAMLAVLATESNAGPGTGSSGGSRASAPASTRSAATTGAGAGNRASSGASGRGLAGPGAGTRSAARPATARPYGQLGTRSPMVPRRSLLAAGTPPSPHLTRIIRERERSGPGWVGTAVLIALLSQHDLSAADRNWIQGKIDALGAEGEGVDKQPLLPPAQRPMSITGATQPLRPGQNATIAVAAAGIPADAVACDIEGVATQPAVTTRDRVANLTWTPEQAGVYILNCRAGKHTERRVLRVASNN